MSELKIAGHCTLCDQPCFEVMQVNEAHERNPGEPKRLGKPLPGSVRVTFMLLDGTKTSLTFCAECSSQSQGELYVSIWQKVIRSWIRELSEKPPAERNPDWLKNQFANGLLCEMGRQPWTEVVNG